MWSNDDKVNDLVEWTTQQAAFVDSRIWFPKDETGTRIEVRADASSAIRPGHPFIEIPFSMTLSFLNAANASASDTFRSHSPNFPAEFVHALPPLCVTAFLMQQDSLGSSSFWYQYLRTAPRYGNGHHPENLTVADDITMAKAKGTSMETEFNELRRQREEEWTTGISMLRSFGWDVTFDEQYLWARTVLECRSFYSSTLAKAINDIDVDYQYLVDPTGSLDNMDLVLLPVLEFLNCDNRAIATYTPRKSSFTLTLDGF
ncbi:hypothetical protein Slin14017_G023130 [Septoria linicola]|nr:hypothetical protein Slin14017_G023130 [Septoria linicola]